MYKDNMDFVCKEEHEEKVQMILRQTDYTEEQAREKLKEFNNDSLLVIKNYFGIMYNRKIYLRLLKLKNIQKY
jgi:hypothetical protein